MSKVLVIEDDEMLNAGLCYNLQKKQIEVKEAYSLADARRILEQGHYDLALLDVNLPDGDQRVGRAVSSAVYFSDRPQSG